MSEHPSHNEILRAEIERLGERNQEHEARYDALETLADHRKAEIERLRADVAELSRVLNGIANREDFASKVLKARSHATDQPGQGTDQIPQGPRRSP